MTVIDSQGQFDFSSVVDAVRSSGDGTLPYVEHVPVVNDRNLLESQDLQTAESCGCFVRPIHPCDDQTMRDIAQANGMGFVLVIFNNGMISRCPTRDRNPAIPASG
jgi:hypothetical protein